MLRACEYCSRKLKRKKVCKRCRGALKRIDNRIYCARYYAKHGAELLARRRAARKSKLAPTIPMDEAEAPQAKTETRD